uniref:Uncharacterized protein n=1 Tax=Ditylenchus dipsaci TaxID=166011 RepID=A0A915DI43_9BILA
MIWLLSVSKCYAEAGMLQRRKASLEQDQQQTPDDVKKKEMKDHPINSLSCLYEELTLLTTRAKHYAVAHKCICNSLGQEMRRISRKGGFVPANYWQANRNIIEGNEQIQCNRRKLSIVFDEILELSLKIENLVLASDAKSKEVLLCQIFAAQLIYSCSTLPVESMKVAENRMTVASPRRSLPFLFSGATSASGVNSTRTFFDNLLYLFHVVVKELRSKSV